MQLRILTHCNGRESTAPQQTDALGTRGVVSVTASAPGLPKLDSSYPKEDDDDFSYYPKEDECYKYDENCEQEFDLNNVDVYQLVVKDIRNRQSGHGQ